MEKKISVKTLYMLFVISFGLIGLGIGSTYAVFTASSEISNPISMSSNLTYDSEIIETIDVTVNGGETISTTLNIDNDGDSSLNYVIWYMDNSNNIDIGVSSGNSSGSLASGGSTSVVIDIRNNSDNNVTLTLGILSSTDSVVIGENMKLVPNEGLPTTLINHIKNLYTSGNPTQVTHLRESGDSDTYYYSYQDTGSTWGLMNDGLKVSSTYGAGSTTITDTTALTSAAEGNIRYFGSGEVVKNYIYFNCDDYSNQSESTCELWRIIGIVDGKVKIMRTDSIGNLAWNYDDNLDVAYSNNWATSSLQLFLNGLYYNRGTTETYTSYSEDNEEILNLVNIGITEETRTNNLISESMWYLGGLSTSSIYQKDAYNNERTNIVGTTILSGNPFMVNANIGLMYPSDYAYAIDLTKCEYDLSTFSAECSDYDWIDNDSYQWMITPDIYGEDVVFLDENGFVDFLSIYYSANVHPVLYLNPELTIEADGDGDDMTPYRIKVK